MIEISLIKLQQCALPPLTCWPCVSVGTAWMPTGQHTAAQQPVTHRTTQGNER